MNSEKITLPSLRNIEWRTRKIETDEINQVLLYIQTNNITKLNELIYAGAPKKYQTGKRQAMMEYMVSGSRNTPPITTD